MNDIYFSTSTNGRIYRINSGTQYLFSIHHPISINGSSIDYDEHQHKLYFSIKNGRDTQVKSIDLETKDEQLVTTLYNTIHIKNFKGCGNGSAQEIKFISSGPPQWPW